MMFYRMADTEAKVVEVPSGSGSESDSEDDMPELESAPTGGEAEVPGASGEQKQSRSENKACYSLFIKIVKLSPAKS
jgi:hypothetical protein